MFSNANNGQYQIWCNYSAAEVMFQNIGQLLKGSLSINLSEVGRILRLGGPKKNIRGGAFSPEIFWIFQTEILEFRGILVPENISRARLGEFRGYLLLLLLSWRGGAGLLGRPWPPWPPSNYLTGYGHWRFKNCRWWRFCSAKVYFSVILLFVRVRQTNNV